MGTEVMGCSHERGRSVRPRAFAMGDAGASKATWYAQEKATSAQETMQDYVDGMPRPTVRRTAGPRSTPARPCP